MAGCVASIACGDSVGVRGVDVGVCNVGGNVGESVDTVVAVGGVAAGVVCVVVCM